MNVSLERIRCSTSQLEKALRRVDPRRGEWIPAEGDFLHYLFSGATIEDVWEVATQLQQEGHYECERAATILRYIRSRGPGDFWYENPDRMLAIYRNRACKCHELGSFARMVDGEAVPSAYQFRGPDGATRLLKRT